MKHMPVFSLKTSSLSAQTFRQNHTSFQIVSASIRRSGWLSSALLLLAATLQPAFGACPGNLLLNWSFETTVGGVPSNWTVESGVAGTTTAYSPPDGVVIGYIWGTPTASPGVLSQQVSASVGTIYTLNFYSGTHNPAVLPTIALRFYNSSGVEIGTPAIHTITTDIDTVGHLGGPYTLNAAAPAGVSYLKVILRDPSNSQAGAKADAMCLTATPGLASLGDYVWNDANHDGIQQTNEAGVSGVTVRLYTNNTVLATTTTAANGLYSFSNLLPGTYSVAFTNLPTGYQFSAANQGANDTKDSDADVTTGRTPTVTLVAGQNYLDLDAGINVKLLDFGDLPDTGSGTGVVGVDAVSTGSMFGGTVATVSHTTGSGANRLMLVGISLNRSTGTTYETVTDVTYGAQNLTLVGIRTNETLGESVVYLYALVNPPAGTANVVASFDTSLVDGAVVGVTTFTNVSQTTPYGPFTSNSGTDTAPTVTVSSAAGQLVFDTVMLRSSDFGASGSPGAGQTELWQTYFNARVGAGASTEPGAASVTLSWTAASAVDWAVGAVAIKPAPASAGPGNYQTLLADNGPRHYIVTGAPRLGANEDAENDGQPNSLATGDDTAGTPDDEDGVTIPALLAGQTAALTINVTGAAGKLDAWMDWNNNGTFDAGEQIATNRSVALGNNTLNVAVPLNATTGTSVGARFRISSAGNLVPTGLASDGEVEDYMVSVAPTVFSLGNRVFSDTGEGGGLANNGIQDGTESGLDGVTVKLFAADVSGNPTGSVLGTQVTDANGYYRFDGLSAGSYVPVVDVTTSGSALAGLISSTGFSTNKTLAGDLLDHGKDTPLAAGSVLPNGIASVSVTLGAGLQPLTEATDAGQGSHGLSGDSADNLTLDFGFASSLIVGSTCYDFGASLVTNPGRDTATNTLYQTQAGTYRTYTIAVSGYDNSGANPVLKNLYLKNTGGDEVGLGFNDTLDHELTLVANGSKPANFVQLDVSQIYQLFTNAHILMGSTTLTESYDVYGSTTKGVIGTLLISAGTIEYPNYVALPAWGSFPYYTVTVHPDPANPADNILFQEMCLGGEKPTFSLGNRVFADNGTGGGTANDGIMNGGELGISGVTVKLFAADASGNPTGSALGTSVTDASGYYRFDGLVAGSYIPVVDVSASGSALAGWVSSTGFSTNIALAGDLKDHGKDTPLGAGSVLTNGIAGVAVALGVGLQPTGETTGAGQGAHGPGGDANDNLTLDFGFLAKASLGDYVWYDVNRDGVQQTNEVGVSGVTVWLYTNNVVLATNVTAANGAYLFTNLLPGTYSVAFTNLPAGYQFSPANQGTNDTKDSDADITTGRTPTVVLVAGQSYLDLDAGINIKPASLGDYVWNDVNRDGIQQTNEVGVSGVTVWLYTNNVVLATNVTAANGAYLFTNLLPGTYSVAFTNLPAGYQLSPATQGGNTALDSDANVVTGRTPTVTLAAGQSYLDLDAGINIKPASLGDYVWYDVNRDGIQQTNEVGVSGVTVLLLTNTATATIATTTTAANGYYAFTNLLPGIYRVVFTNLPAGSQFSPATQGSNTALDSDASTNAATIGRSPTVTLVAGQNYPDFDAGINVKPMSLGNRVFADNGVGTGGVANDGLQNGTEPGIANVIVKLFAADASGNPTGSALATTNSDASGYYRFDGLNPGSYVPVVDVTASGAALSGFISSPGFSTNTGIAGDLRDHGKDTPLGAGSVLTNGIAGVSVTLGLSLQPTGEAISGTGQGASGPNGDATDNLVMDFGFAPLTFSVGNRVFRDNGAGGGTNNNGFQDGSEPGLPLVVVKLFAADGSGNPTGSALATNTTDLSGYYRFDGLPAGTYVVVVDAKASGPALAGLVSSTNLTTNTTLAGDKRDHGKDTPLATVSVLPGGYASAPVTLGVGLQPLTEALSVSGAGTNGPNGDASDNLTVDFGFIAPVPDNPPVFSLGNRVWLDSNNNGVQDGGETGISNVVMKLFAADATGTPTSLALAVTNTDINGYYRFDAVTGGTYVVVVDVTASGLALSNWVSSTSYTTNMLLAGDTYDHGKDTPLGSGSVVTNGIISTPVTIGPVAPPTGEATGPGAGANGPNGDAADNLVVDFGFTPTYSIGNRVFRDNGVGGGVANNGLQDGGELGLANVVLKLFAADGSGNPTGTARATTTNDANGYYRFDGVPAGTYVVVVDKTSSASLTGLVTSTGSTTNMTAPGDLRDHGKDTPVSIDTVVNGIASTPVTVGQGLQPTGEVTSTGAGAHGPNDDANDNLVVDFGFYNPNPTLATISSFTGRWEAGRVKLAWTSVAEFWTLGYNVYAGQPDGSLRQVNGDWVFGSGNPLGGSYELEDTTVSAPTVVTYWLEEVDYTLKSTWFDPIVVVVPGPASVTGARMTGAGFELTFTGQAGVEYQVQASENLAAGVWETLTTATAMASPQLQTLTATAGRFTVVDPAALGKPMRFYRALPH